MVEGHKKIKMPNTRKLAQQIALDVTVKIVKAVNALIKSPGNYARFSFFLADKQFIITVQESKASKDKFVPTVGQMTIFDQLISQEKQDSIMKEVN